MRAKFFLIMIYCYMYGKFYQMNNLQYVALQIYTFRSIKHRNRTL